MKNLYLSLCKNFPIYSFFCYLISYVLTILVLIKGSSHHKNFCEELSDFPNIEESPLLVGFSLAFEANQWDFIIKIKSIQLSFRSMPTILKMTMGENGDDWKQIKEFLVSIKNKIPSSKVPIIPDYSVPTYVSGTEWGIQKIKYRIPGLNMPLANFPIKSAGIATLENMKRLILAAAAEKITHTSLQIPTPITTSTATPSYNFPLNPTPKECHKYAERFLFTYTNEIAKHPDIIADISKRQIFTDNFLKKYPGYDIYIKNEKNRSHIMDFLAQFIINSINKADTVKDKLIVDNSIFMSTIIQLKTSLTNKEYNEHMLNIEGFKNTLFYITKELKEKGKK